MSEPQPVAVTAPPGTMPKVRVGFGEQYQDHEGAKYVRVSTLIKKIETDDYQLKLWDKRQVAVGMALRADLVTAVKAMGQEPDGGWTKEQKKELNGIAKDAATAAKRSDGGRLGTARHTLTERLDRGEALEQVARGLPATEGTTIRAYDKFLKLNGVRVLEIERSVRHVELDTVGSLDRVYAWPALAYLGPWVCQHGHEHAAEETQVIGDVKSEKDPTYNGLHIGAQLGIYASAPDMWLPEGSGGYVPTLCVRQDVAVVIHFRDGKVVPYFVNITDGLEAARAARAQYDRESAAKGWLVPVPNVVEPKPAETLVDHHAAKDPASPAFVGQYLPDANGVIAQESYRRPDGMVDWRPVDPEAGFAPADAPPPGQTDMQRHLIAAIWQASHEGRLGELWMLAKENGVPWDGAVAAAGEARQAQLKCPQRQLHHGGPGTRCACGWTPEVPA